MDKFNKRFKDFTNESIKSNLILDESYFLNRVPFFKDFKNDSTNNNVSFTFSQSWENVTIPPIETYIPHLSVDTNFMYYTIMQRDFEQERKLEVFRPLLKTEHHIIYSTNIFLKVDKEDTLNSIVALMIKEVIKNELKLHEVFHVKDGDALPMTKIDEIINTINKNCFKIEETIEKMGLKYF